MDHAKFRSLIKFACKMFLLVFCVVWCNVSCSTKYSHRNTDNRKPDVLSVGRGTFQNSLAVAYPESLIFTLFPQNIPELPTNVSSDTEISKTAKLAINNRTFNAIYREDAGFLNAEKSACVHETLNLSYVTPLPQTCYTHGQDMLRGTLQEGTGAIKYVGVTNGQGAGGEACLVEFTRSSLYNNQFPLQFSEGVLKSAFCQAYSTAVKTSAATTNPDLLPKKVGDSLDLSAHLKKVFAGASGNSVISAKITRAADVKKQALYQTFIDMNDTSGEELNLILSHSPKTDANAEYNGVLTIIIKPPTGTSDRYSPTKDSFKNYYMSISYVRKQESDATYSISYQMLSGRFDSKISPVSTNGTLDFNLNADFTSDVADPKFGNYKKDSKTFYTTPDEAAENLSSVSIYYNEGTQKQEINYWTNLLAEYYDNAFGFLFIMSPDNTAKGQGAMTGCVNAGIPSQFALDPVGIRRAAREAAKDPTRSLVPRGFYHPAFSTDLSQAPISSPCSYAVGKGNELPLKFSKTILCVDNSLNQMYQWTPSYSIEDFYKKIDGPYITSQCFRQDLKSGKYLIDPSFVSSADGYDVIKYGSSKTLLP